MPDIHLKKLLHKTNIHNKEVDSCQNTCQIKSYIQSHTVKYIKNIYSRTQKGFLNPTKINYKQR
jgi:hypothetical protein